MHVMVNFMCQFMWATGLYIWPSFLDVPVEVFLDEMNI